MDKGAERFPSKERGASLGRFDEESRIVIKNEVQVAGKERRDPEAAWKANQPNVHSVKMVRPSKSRGVSHDRDDDDY